MRLLSFDCGLRHLAYCLLDSASGRIDAWGVLEVSYDRFDSMPGALVAALDSALLERLGGVDLAVVERQPGRNPKMVSVQHLITAWCEIRARCDRGFLPGGVHVVRAADKLGAAGRRLRGKRQYRARKRLAVDLAEEWLAARPQEAGVRSVWDAARKRDDLADSLLQAVAYAERVGVGGGVGASGEVIEEADSDS